MLHTCKIIRTACLFSGTLQDVIAIVRLLSDISNKSHSTSVKYINRMSTDSVKQLNSGTELLEDLVKELESKPL